MNLDLEPEFFKSYRHSESWGNVERNVFYTKIDEDIEKLRECQTEGDGMDFFSREEMKDLTINENHRFIIDEFFKEKF
ncbi:MAG: hypothetical protein COX80_01230 [Candidatus Magasanikbacteria bacterium CG_4_10_14_0_2_um_filter_33_14]|uniref:Uncharacterized protein n=1 Tax=Candidatus Magasanikbacteria bacterium CG_4_10_14_0_2_um_filter_33_14 TaxID=1974636 RepID=A0A2M7VBL2_9BACT|nr:MAG: hypothetical protein COX80_01230 [Candidatus Magasanikbacteria bacterium CG_4_10_14_0_2_um_filter_33_14]